MLVLIVFQDVTDEFFVYIKIYLLKTSIIMVMRVARRYPPIVTVSYGRKLMLPAPRKAAAVTSWLHQIICILKKYNLFKNLHLMI